MENDLARKEEKEGIKEEIAKFTVPKRDDEEGILKGVIDLHCHAGPCVYGKDFDEIELAQMMRYAGYRGVLFKQHLLGANRSSFVRRAVPGIEIFGGVTLNQYVGGINPLAVASCIAFGGKEVKFPNIHAANHIEVFGSPTYSAIASSGGAEFEKRVASLVKGITILDDNDKLLPEVYTILELVRDADIGVETGHLSQKETRALIKAAKELGIEKVWVTHANWKQLFDYSPNDLREIADGGAYIEIVSVFAHKLSQDSKEIEYTIKIIREVGAERCTMGSDLGTEGRINPIDGLRVFIRSLIALGISRDDIDKMTKVNPARLLGLD